MSSRNVYLSPAERLAAPVLFRALNAAREAFEGGEHNPERLRMIVSTLVTTEPLASLQYISCADAASLEELETPITGRALLSMAVYFGKTRLIDNMVLE
jgi:pantoate--beta-alanine ligase